MSQVLSDSSYRRDRTSAADQVVNDIRAQILSRHLPRGTRLPSEKELAARYDVSPPTIREAIRALSATNLVESRHGSGTYVTADGSTLVSSALAAVVELEDIDLLSILDVSETFYLKAGAIAIDEATAEELQALRACAESFRATMEPLEFRDALKDFLTRLVELSHNKLLIAISNFLIESQITLAQNAADQSPAMWEKIAGHLVDERIDIVTSLEERDAVRVRSAIETYMLRGNALVREHAAPKP